MKNYDDLESDNRCTFLLRCALIISLLSATCSCRKVFVRYESSPWETTWIENAKLWRDLECQKMAEPYHLERALWSVYQAQKKNRSPVVNDRPAVSFDDDEIFSKFVYRCNGRETFEYIEPLVGILRDPLTMCPGPYQAVGRFDDGENWIQAKRYQIYEPAATEGTHLSYCEENSFLCTLRLLFDVGASTYHGIGDDPSFIGSKWFVKNFANFNVSFDHIYAFEFKPRSPSDVFFDLPVNLLARYSYYNMGVSSKIGDVWNVWSFVKEIARPADHVLVKLDIDSPGIEENFIIQLKNDPVLLSLVDEMTYEDHVDCEVMRPYWGLNNARKMTDSYDDFLFLRKNGVRMHSWP